MSPEVSKLTPEIAQDAYIVFDDADKVDLKGDHEGRIFYVERKISAKGTPYHSVGVEIASGLGQGHSVFGVVFRGKSRNELLRAIGQDSGAPVSKLVRDQVIGKCVRITVEAEEQETVGGGSETRWVIRAFAPLA